MKHAWSSATSPALSVVIAVYNDWLPLDHCLRSLAEQGPPPSVEVMIIDDGSQAPAPEFILKWGCSYPLSVIRQTHAGIPAARNRGIQAAQGSVLLFVDADCKLQAGCLIALDLAVASHPKHNCFQLRLTGDCSNVVGRAEELRLVTLQDHLLQRDGCIRYLNTAGFAIRRAKADVERGLFDRDAFRGEDTLLLTDLMQSGELPFFVTNAVVQHAIPLTLMQCFRKDIRSGYLAGRTERAIATKGIKIRMGHRERLRMLRGMWKVSRRRSIGRPAWFVLATRQTLERTFSTAVNLFRR